MMQRLLLAALTVVGLLVLVLIGFRPDGWPPMPAADRSAEAPSTVDHCLERILPQQRRAGSTPHPGEPDIAACRALVGPLVQQLVARDQAAQLLPLLDRLLFDNGDVPEANARLEAGLTVAQGLSLAGDLASASALVSQLLRQPHLGADAQHRLLAYRGRLAQRQGKAVDAQRDWATAIAVSPTLPQAFLARGLWYSSQGEQEKALSDLHAAYLSRDNAPGFVMPTARYGRLLRLAYERKFLDGDLDGATLYLALAEPVSSSRELSRLLDRLFLAPRLKFERGDAPGLLNDLALAEAVIVEAAQGSSGGARLRLLFDLKLGKFNTSIGKVSVARQLARSSAGKLIDDPDWADSSADDRAELLAEAAQVLQAADGSGAETADPTASQEVRRWLTQALDWSPDNSRARYHRAVLAHQAGAHQQAVADFDRALGDPGFAAAFPADARLALFQRAISRYALGNFAAAQQDLSNLLALEPEQPLARYWRGRALARLGQTQQALADFDLSLPRLSPQLLNNLSDHLVAEGWQRSGPEGRYSLPMRRALEGCLARGCL